MNITRIWKVFFSPTGNTEKSVSFLTEELRKNLDRPIEEYDFTLPAARETVPEFSSGDLVVFGMPVYAGKLPNKMLSFVKEAFDGNGALAIPIVTFGNRSFDNGLAELTTCLENSGFYLPGAAAIAANHAFSHTLAAGRPDSEDLALLTELAGKTTAKIAALKKAADLPHMNVPGDSDAPYYTPLGLDGKPAVFLKAKPKTDIAKCVSCGLCSRNCPMGSIDTTDHTLVNGICIKCHSCVRRCPKDAKYFDDPPFLSHKAMLETNYQERKASSIYIK